MKIKTQTMTKVLLSCCAILLAGSCSAAPQEAHAMKDARTQQILGNQFRVGVYYYDSGYKPFPDPRNKSLDEIKRDINDIADEGFNYVHVQINMRPGVAEYPELDTILEVAAKRNMAVRVQWEKLAYLANSLTGRRTGEWKPGWNAQKLAHVVVPYIKKYKDNPQIIDFSVQEEPTGQMLPRLHEYYQAIRDQIPDVRLYLLYNSAYISQLDIDNLYPESVAGDVYPFRHYPHTRLLPTPNYAVAYYDQQIGWSQRVAQQHNQAFEAVLGSFSELMVYTPQQFLESLTKYKNDAERQAAFDNFMLLAKAGNQGFSLDADGNIRRWNRYFAPPNYVSAMAWIALANGADSESMYCWAGRTGGQKNFAFNILGRDGKGTYGLAEFAAFAKDIRPFGKLFRSARRDVTPYNDTNIKDIPSPYTPPQPIGSITPEEILGAPVLETTEADLMWRSFTLPDLKGKLVVVVNTLGGTWSDGKSPLNLEENPPFHINDNGELTDYTAFTKDRTVQAKVLLPHTQVTNLMTGKPVPISSEGMLKLDIAPGGGQILFLSPAGSDETQKLISEYLKP